MLLAVAALTPSACSGGNCGAACLDGTITFALTTPLRGQRLAISVAPPTAAAITIDCRPADGSTGCTPASSAIVPLFDGQGSLQSFEMPFFGVGSYRAQVEVDGAPKVDQMFQYDLGPVAGVCGTSCYRSTTFEISN